MAIVLSMAAGAMSCGGSYEADAEGGGGDDVGVDAGSAGGDDDPVGEPDAAPAPMTPECYLEPVFPAADVSDLVAAYGGPDWKNELIAAMERRWPAGAWLLEAQRNDPYFDRFSDPGSWTGMVDWLGTLVHEETHLWNAYHAQDVGAAHSLYVRPDLVFDLPEEDGFPRAEILDLVAPEARGIYADTYLTGEQGRRGFHALLDELTAYANELPGMGLFGEYYQGAGVSLRDGSAAFLYFLELYLRRARTAHPEFYAAAKASPVYRQAVATLWLRTHYFLERVDAHPTLGIDDAKYRALLHAPENVAEIEMFLDRRVGDSSCYLD